MFDVVHVGFVVFVRFNDFGEFFAPEPVMDLVNKNIISEETFALPK